jgi:predicted GIY-YIG superfamily endonuclease
MHYLYILQSQANLGYYVGVTKDVEKRLRGHNSGHVRSTAPHVPWVVKRIEEFSSASLAYQRERFIKAKHSRKIIEKIVDSEGGKSRR